MNSYGLLESKKQLDKTILNKVNDIMSNRRKYIDNTQNTLSKLKK